MSDMLTCTFICCSIVSTVLTCTFICYSSSILSADAETRLTEPSRTLERWAEHFSDVLNRPSIISQAAIDNRAQRPLMDELAYRPTLDEITAAIKKLSSEKAAGPDAIAAEIYKYGGINLTKSLVKLFNDIWDSRAVPQESKDATVVRVYKRKGNKSICDNHRGISLPCIAGKILMRILLNRLSLHLADNVLPESVRLPSSAQLDRHDIPSSPGTGEVQRAKPISVHGVCRPDESFRHNQQRWFMADTTKDWLP